MAKEDDKNAEFSNSAKFLENVINQEVDTVDLSGKKVVWVEDDSFLNGILKRKLSTTKCVFFNATEGEEALKIINRELPDVVMLDIILPGMDGFEILRRLKSEQKTKSIPVIILSNLGQVIDIEKGKSLGAEIFMVKANVTPDEIVKKIKEVVSGSK